MSSPSSNNSSQDLQMREFQPGQLVWALLDVNNKIHRSLRSLARWPWPARISIDPEIGQRKPGEHYYVYFYVYNISEYALKENVFDYIENVNSFSTPPRKNRMFSAAVRYIHEQYWCLVELQRDAVLSGGIYVSFEDRKQIAREEKKSLKLKSVHYLEVDTELSRPLKRLKMEVARNNPPEFAQYIPYIEDDSNLPEFIQHEDRDWEFQKEDNETVALFNYKTYDIRTVPKFPSRVRAKCRTCNVNFGFIGLRSANKMLIYNILSNKRHVVNFWSKIPFKYEEFLSLGAIGHNTPQDVILSSDVIFCTMPDEDVSLHFRYTYSGIYDGLAKSTKSRKIYVCIIALDNEPDQDMKKAVAKFGCIYFEIRVGFSRDNVDPKPVFLCAGHPAVFKQIRSYLLYVSDDIHYLGTRFDVRRADKVPDCLITRVKYKSTPFAYAIFESLGYNFILFNDSVESCDLSRDKNL